MTYSTNNKITSDNVGNIPADVQEIIIRNISDSDIITTLLPTNINSIDLCQSDLPSFSVEPSYIGNIKKIKISYCKNLRSFEHPLPPSLKIVEFYGCNSVNLANLERIESLTIGHSNEVREITNIPPSLKSLNVHYCDSLTAFPNPLPSSLKKLSIYGCNSLTDIPQIPDGLELVFISFSNCSSIPNNDETIEKLLDLERRYRDKPNFRLVWPKHINRESDNNKISRNIQEAYRVYHANNPDFRDRDPAPNSQFPTYHLIHRFITEDIEQRGNPLPILIFEEALKLSEILKSNPHFLEFTDASAKNFLFACVNQPVAGFSEVVSLVHIASQPDIQSKLEKSKIIIAKAIISEETRNITTAEGRGAVIEVEIANGFLREVHDKLLLEGIIREPWQGVPRRLMYETFARPYLNNRDYIEDISRKTSEALSLSSEHVAEKYFDDTHVLGFQFKDFWSKIVVSKEKRDELMQPYIVATEQCLETGATAEELTAIKLNCQEKIFDEAKKITFEAIRSRAGSPTSAVSRPVGDTRAGCVSGCNIS